MEVSVDLVRKLREQTGAGIMACKAALEEAQGDLEEATALLRRQGLSIAAKRTGRETNEGIIDAYVHSGSRVGALVEVNCETDFVAHTPEFRELVHNLAMQVAAMKPSYVSRAEVPPENEVDPEECCLLEQPFIRDTARTVQDLINDTVVKVGENIRVRRFARFSLGE